MPLTRALRFPILALCLGLALRPAPAAAATLSDDLTQILNLHLLSRVNVKKHAGYGYGDSAYHYHKYSEYYS